MPDAMRRDSIRAKLAQKGDTSTRAAQRRYAAAIAASGMNKTAFAAALGLSGTQAITNSTTGKNYPSRDGMIYLYENYRIDPTFIMTGDYGQLPSDVLDPLFAELQALANAEGQR